MCVCHVKSLFIQWVEERIPSIRELFADDFKKGNKKSVEMEEIFENNLQTYALKINACEAYLLNMKDEK